jgi:Mycolic acid cyclopropane synthetase
MPSARARSSARRQPARDVQHRHADRSRPPAPPVCRPGEAADQGRNAPRYTERPDTFLDDVIWHLALSRGDRLLDVGCGDGARHPAFADRGVRITGLDASKQRRYGTLLINVETHRPVDLLDDRAAEVFANWLRCHPASRSSCAIVPARTPKGASALLHLGLRSAIRDGQGVGTWQNSAAGAQLERTRRPRLNLSVERW